jgi:hypothetical protein
MMDTSGIVTGNGNDTEYIREQSRKLKRSIGSNGSVDVLPAAFEYRFRPEDCPKPEGSVPVSFHEFDPGTRVDTPRVTTISGGVVDLGRRNGEVIIGTWPAQTQKKPDGMLETTTL